jgi:MoaA/NifB/PqqE/SkfB family radical SAM enzyme
MTETLKEQLKKEQTTTEKKHWVRLTSVCNNACLFCLDYCEDMSKQKHLSVSAIEKDLQKGIKAGARRVILSGGEATIHPDFIKIVKKSKSFGYQHVQVISNGRMFCYDKFLDEAVSAGLNEITFSVHGDTAKLHDRLTGVENSFVQVVEGIKKSKKKKNLIVSLDVCINKMNYQRLPFIVAKFFRLGVWEFDLLHIAPFGRAWENRDVMLYDLRKLYPYLKKTLEFSEENNINIWTNRLPSQYLEGFEDKIQDPYKLHSEIDGQKEMMNKYLFSGKDLECSGERCSYCYMRFFCEKLKKWKKEMDKKVLNNIFLNLDKVNFDTFEKTLNYFQVKRIYLQSSSVEKLEKYLSLVDNDLEVIIDTDFECKKGRMESILQKFKNCTLVISRENEIKLINNLDMKFYLEINKDTSRTILDNAKNLTKKIEKISFYKKNYLLLSEELAKGTDLKIFFEKLYKITEVKFTAINLPRCYNGIENKKIDFFDVDVLDSNLRIDIHAFVDFYIKNENFARSLSCDECIYGKECSGVNLNYIRSFGFDNLSPKKIYE